MPDNSSNIIKPVESLHNVAGLTPAKRRQERKRRQNLRGKHNKQAEQELDDAVDREKPDKTPVDDENDRHSIDYCA